MSSRRFTVCSLAALLSLAVGIVVAAPAASDFLAAGDQYTPSGGGQGPDSGGGQNPDGGGGGQNPAGGGGGGGGENPAGGGGQNPAGGGGDQAPANGGGAGAGPTAATGETAAGDLPFTGYPLTPLLWLVIALVGGGLAFRLISVATARRRVASS